MRSCFRRRGGRGWRDRNSLKSHAVGIGHNLDNKKVERENDRYLILSDRTIMTALLISTLSTVLSLSSVFAQKRGPSYEYHCSVCKTVWYKSVGGYSKCPNSGCENNKAGRGSSGIKVN